MTSKVSVIILNYKGDNFLPKLFASIKKQNYQNLETILINNSPSHFLLRNRKITVINNPHNLGFSLANNLAAKKACGKYLFFLNNDIKLGPKVITTLVNHLEDNPKSGIVGCKMKNYSGTKTYHTGIGLDPLGFPVANAKTFYIEGSTLMIKKGLFLKLGGFDPSYFMFHEDINLSWKARLLGFKPLALPKAVVYHVAGASAGGTISLSNRYQSSYLRRYYSERNNLKTILKNYSFTSLLIILPLYIITNLAEIIVFTFTLNFKLVFLYLKAYLWNLINLPQTLKQRRHIQTTRKIKDQEIFSKMYLGSGKLVSLKKVGLPKFK